MKKKSKVDKEAEDFNNAMKSLKEGDAPKTSKPKNNKLTKYFKRNVK